MAIRKDKGGSWIVDISNGFDPITLKQRRIVRKGFKTKKEATDAEYYLRTVELKENSYKSKITISMLYSMLKEEDIRNNRKISYINTQENNYNRHIKDYFSKVYNVSKLTYDDIYRFREELQQKKSKNKNENLSSNTVNKILILLKKIIDIGVRKGLYINNPAKHLKKLPIQKIKIEFWTIQEFKKFLKLFKEDEYNIKLLFIVLFFTGVRLGEALALTWKDIDFSSNTIHITKSVYESKGKRYINGTKTKSGTRRIIINNKLCSELLSWQKKQELLLKDFSNDILSLHIFQDNPIIITKGAIQKKYKKILERDNSLKKIRIHDFRHSHASLLINQGEDYLVVKERLGHASITTTIDTYAHLYPSKQKVLADKLDELL